MHAQLIFYYKKRQDGDYWILSLIECNWIEMKLTINVFKTVNITSIQFNSIQAVLVTVGTSAIK